MPDTQDNAFMRFLNEKLVPFSTKVAQNKYIQAIGGGSMSAAIWFPFFKVADNQALKEEQDAEVAELAA